MRQFPRPSRWLGLLVIGLLFGGGCASVRTLESGYPEVAAALRQRFQRNEWKRGSTARGTFQEGSGRLDFTYYEWEYPDLKVRCEVTAKARGRNQTKVTVYIKDFDSWFSPFMFCPSWAHRLLDALEQRLATGHWEKLPWGGTAVDPNRLPGAEALSPDTPLLEMPPVETDNEEPLLIPTE